MSNTRVLERPPVRRYRGGRARQAAPSLLRDFAVIVGIWAVMAYPVLWTAYHVAGPALLRFMGDTAGGAP